MCALPHAHAPPVPIHPVYIGVPAARAGWFFAAAEACVPRVGLPSWRTSRVAHITPSADAGADAAGVSGCAVARQALQAQVRGVAVFAVFCCVSVYDMFVVV